MDLKELRIGNIVWWHTDGTKYIDEIGINDFLEINNGNKIISPIFITEEWMIKAGFEFYSSKEKDGWVGYGTWSDKSIKLIAHREILDMYFGSGIINIRHLHQLQNLYKSITGIELSINY